MITALVLVFVAVSLISLLLVGEPNQEQVYAQTQGTNFTQLFSTDKEFQICIEDIPGAGCVPILNVLYQDPTLLVLQSGYIDVIWKGVALAHKEGYQIDAMTSYSVSGVTPGSSQQVNLLVAMSK